MITFVSQFVIQFRVEIVHLKLKKIVEIDVIQENKTPQSANFGTTQNSTVDCQIR